MLLPDSNLPSSSLPWAREVVKRIDSLSRAVNTSEVNNAARDATAETNISNLSELMADQLELRTYAIDPKRYDVESFVGSPGLPTSQYFDTPELTMNITVNKQRNFLITFSTNYAIQLLGPTAPAYYWDIRTEIYLDGELVGGANAYKDTGASYIYESEGSSLTSTSFVPVSPGEHVVSVKISYASSSSGADTFIFIDGNNLVVTVVQ